MTCQVLAKIRNNWNSQALLGRMQNGTATLENSWTVFAQLNTQLPYDFAILHLDIYCRELKMYVHTKTCMWIFIATLFVITKIGNNPVSLNGLMDKQTLWHSYHGILFSSKKLLIHAATWIDLKGIVLEWKMKSQRFHTVWFNLCDVLEKRKL